MEMPEGLITMCWARMSKVFDSLDNKIQSVKDVMSVELHKAYNDGYEAARKELAGKTYEQGLNDAWECARKIVCSDGLMSLELKQIFQHSFGVSKILMDNSPEEAIAKIKQFEAEKEQKLDAIKVGDEVYGLDPNHKSVVTSILEDCNKAVLISASGKWATEYLKNLHKTGRHYSELEIMLDKLKGNKDE